MTDAHFNILDVLDLPPQEREVFLHLARNGPADARTLAQALGLGEDELQATLASLKQKRRVQLLSDGQAEAVLGRIVRRMTLPAELLPAFLTTDRLYTDQDIATLRTAIPMLQFARARLSVFADHGPAHAMRVKLIARQLGYLLGLSDTERHFLGTAALFHDIGNIVERKRHHIISQETVEKLAAQGKLPFTPDETQIIGLVSRWHRGEYDPQHVDRVGAEHIRTGLMASILRVADAMDIDHRRADYGPRLREVLNFFFASELLYWTSLEEIWGVRLRCAPDPSIQVFTRDEVENNIQINGLYKDMASTPLNWPIQTISVPSSPPESLPFVGKTRKAGNALIAFPFEPHSLIMTAVSRRHLSAAGYEVELLCYPDTESGPAWLWGNEALGNLNAGSYQRILVIGDRPAPQLDATILDVLAQWKAAGVRTSLLNRYEANWRRIPRLVGAGAEVILGGEWSYFWGDFPTPSDLYWGRIAALCVHDPTLTNVSVADAELGVMQGVLQAVYEAVRQPAMDTTGWSALAEPILEHIAADDTDYFVQRAGQFLAEYARPLQPSKITRRALRVDGAPGVWPQAYYWALEAAIEAQGRKPQRGIQFKRPYAIATWSSGDTIEIFAINHWLEEEALPIRLLYPVDIAAHPEGTENTIHVRLPAESAEAVINRLLAACDQQ